MKQRRRAGPRQATEHGVRRPTEDGERLSESIWERARERGKCFPSWMLLKEGIVPASLWGKLHQSHRLAADSIDHLQSFIPPIKMLSVHITFVFLWWTQLLLHKDTVVINIQFYGFWLLWLWFYSCLLFVARGAWPLCNGTKMKHYLYLNIEHLRAKARNASESCKVWRKVFEVFSFYIVQVPLFDMSFFVTRGESI